MKQKTSRKDAKTQRKAQESRTNPILSWEGAFHKKKVGLAK